MIEAERTVGSAESSSQQRAGDDRMDRQIDYEQALLDPSTQFSRPEAVLKEVGLTREQKIEILRRWAYDESEISVAEEEGMKGGESSLLQPILIALEQLK